jgi:hypothetical protein
MGLEIDGIEKVIASGARAQTLLVGGVAREIQGAVQRAVDNEKRSHRYQNRTGDAEKFTRAKATVNGATAEMAVPYAQALNARGLSEFDIWMDRADFESREAFDAIASRL